MNIIFPSEPKVQYPYEKTPIFNTMVKRAASRREYRATYWSDHPTWEFTVPLNGITRDEMFTMAGFLAKVRGALHDFYFRDAAPTVTGEQSVQGIYNTDYSIWDELANIGNGVKTQFQLFRNWDWWYLEYPKFPPFSPTGYGMGGLQGDSSGGGTIEQGYGVPIWDVPHIYIDGVLQENDSNSTCQYTISQTGLVTFTPAPALNSVLTTDYIFYYKCRLKEDYGKFKRVAPDAWALDEPLVLITVE